MCKDKEDTPECNDLRSQCRAVWKTDQKYVLAACDRAGCDRMCRKSHFSWCGSEAKKGGLSAGAIVGIVIGGVTDGVAFLVIKNKNHPVAAH
jgi:hypothetical protein